MNINFKEMEYNGEMVLKVGKLYRVNNRMRNYPIGTQLIKIFLFLVKNEAYIQSGIIDTLNQGDIFFVNEQTRIKNFLYYKIVRCNKEDNNFTIGYTEGFQFIGENRHSLWFEEAINSLGI